MKLSNTDKLVIIIVLLVYAAFTQTYSCNRDKNYVDERLWDMGHNLTPDLEGSEFANWLNNKVTWVPFIIFAVALILQRNKNAFTLTINLIFIVHVLWAMRSFLYVSTRLPSSTERCRLNKTQCCKFQTAYYKNCNTSGGCGDLLWSGHVMTTIIAVLFIMHHNMVSPQLRPLIWLLIPIQAFLVVATRSHYTVDAIIALIVGPLIFFYLKHGNNAVLRSLDLLQR